MRKIALFAFVSFSALVVQAQVPTSGNVFFGYSYSGGDAFVHNSGFVSAAHGVNLNGWEGSLEGKFLPWIGIVADLSGRYGSQHVPACLTSTSVCVSAGLDVKTYTFLFGPRVSVSVGKFTPFADALVGAGHVTDNGSGLSNSDTSLATAIGGGLDYKLIKGAAWRVQGDEIHTRFFGSTQDHFRFSTGIVIRF